MCVDSTGNRRYSGKEKLKGECILQSTSKGKLVPRHVTKGKDESGKKFSRFFSIFDVINTHLYSQTTYNMYVQPSLPLHRKYIQFPRKTAVHYYFSHEPNPPYCTGNPKTKKRIYHNLNFTKHAEDSAHTYRYT